MKRITERALVLIHVAVNIGLVIIFVYFFGQNSVRKYLDNAVIVSKQEETATSIPPPGKKIFSMYLLQSQDDFATYYCAN